MRHFSPALFSCFCASAARSAQLCERRTRACCLLAGAIKLPHDDHAAGYPLCISGFSDVQCLCVACVRAHPFRQTARQDPHARACVRTACATRPGICLRQLRCDRRSRQAADTGTRRSDARTGLIPFQTALTHEAAAGVKLPALWIGRLLVLLVHMLPAQCWHSPECQLASRGLEMLRAAGATCCTRSNATRHAAPFWISAVPVRQALCTPSAHAHL